MSDKKIKPWLIRPDDVKDEQGHIWFTWDKIVGCKRCGLVKRVDKSNAVCKGTTGGIGLRTAA